DAEIGNHLDDWRARVHPEDAERMMAEALSSTNCGSDGYELEQRMLHKDGSVRWFLTRGSVMRRVDGTPHRVVGSSVDITERKRSAERFRIALEAAPAGMFMVDRTGKIALVNSQIEKLFGYAREELINMPVEMLVPERFRGQHSACRAGFSGDPRARAMGGGRDLW